MPSLKIAVVQADLYWENKIANFSNLEEMIMSQPKDVDLIVLPEMFSTGFTMHAKEYGEPIGLNTTKWLIQIAKATKSTICGSFIVKEETRYYNRFLALNPKGEIICTYDKQYLFPLSFEHEVFSAGDTVIHFEVGGVKIKPQICYDLRFPESARYAQENPYDILLYVANWPAKRSAHWDVLLKARAIENQAFVVACNRVGVDGNELEYNGHSQVVSPDGEVLFYSENEEVMYVLINTDTQQIYKEKFPVLKSIKS